MSTADFVRFYEEYVPQHAELEAKFNAITNEEEFAKLALEAGKKGGFSFTKEEMAAVMKASEAAIKVVDPTPIVTIRSVASRKNVLDRHHLQVKGKIGAVGAIESALGERIKAEVPSTVMCCW